MTSNEVMVSVVMTTYNHETYLAEAIESVLRQRTTFPYEIVIGEDCSADKTRLIAERYVEQYPDTIRLVTSEHNVGLRANYRRTIAAARGRYVALLDGDDLFIDEHKLQRQVDMLETDASLGMCYTRSIRRNEHGGESIYPEGVCATSFEAMLRRNPAENCTVVARRALVEQYYADVRPDTHPEWLTDDLPMWLWFAANSRYAAIDAPMAVHRVLTHSVSHSPDYRRRIAFCDSLSDICIWYDERYNSCRLRRELQRSKQNTALWVLSFNGSVGEYISRWWCDVRRTPRLMFNIAAYGLFVKKIAWRMWRKNRLNDDKRAI